MNEQKRNSDVTPETTLNILQSHMLRCCRIYTNLIKSLPWCLLWYRQLLLLSTISHENNVNINPNACTLLWLFCQAGAAATSNIFHWITTNIRRIVHIRRYHIDMLMMMMGWPLLSCPGISLAINFNNVSPIQKWKCPQWKYENQRRREQMVPLSYVYYCIHTSSSRFSSWKLLLVWQQFFFLFLIFLCSPLLFIFFPQRQNKKCCGSSERPAAHAKCVMWDGSQATA